MLTAESCARCRRPSPPVESHELIYWEALGADGAEMICPECITSEEQQQMDEDDMEMAELVDGLADSSDLVGERIGPRCRVLT